VPKITKMDAFSLFQSETSIFHDERASCASFPGAKKARMVRLQSPKFTMVMKKTKAMTDKHTDKHPKYGASNTFKFQISDSNRAKNAHEVVSGAKKIAPRQYTFGHHCHCALMIKDITIF
jgi:hypothetical protein